MFFIYMIISFTYMFGSIYNGSMTPLMGQIWVLVTLSVGSVVYGLEIMANARRKDKQGGS